MPPFCRELRIEPSTANPSNELAFSRRSSHRKSKLLRWFLAKVLYGRVSGPVILHSSKSAVAGDIIYLQGSQFGSTPFVQYSYNDSNWQFAKILSALRGYVSIQYQQRRPVCPTYLRFAFHLTMRPGARPFM